MPKKPSKIVFTCESCGCSPKLSCRTLREGDCRKCDQCVTWKVEAHYTEKNTNYGRTALGIFGLLVFQRGWLLDQSVHTNKIGASSVTKKMVRTLVADDRLVMERVVEFLRSSNEKEMQRKGAIQCKTCHFAFVASESKTWTLAGYCSVSCSEEGGELVEDHQFVQQQSETKSPTIPVCCPNGHNFSCLASFAGCLRPCPHCSSKCRVPG